MHRFGILGISAITLLSLLQPCSAALATAAALAGTVAGSAVTGLVADYAYQSISHKRDVPILPSELEACRSQLSNANLTLTLKKNKGLHLEGIPSACMDLASNATDSTSGTLPNILGDTILEYNNATQEELNQILPAAAGMKSVKWSF